MRVISNKCLVAFAARHGDADSPLQAWHRIMKEASFASFADLKRAFNATDKVGDYCVFDIGGNKYRLIAAVHFNRQMVFIRHLLTHKEYDKWKP